MDKILNVYLYSQMIGQLQQDSQGKIKFNYTKEWINNPKAVSLSQSLPLLSEAFTDDQCQPFFGGLLPEGQLRENIARIFQVSPRNNFALLYHIGEECAGAVTIIPAHQTLPVLGQLGAASALSEEELVKKIDELPKRPLLAGEHGIRISLAGVQKKLPVIFTPKDHHHPMDRFIGDEIHLPITHHPTTHIIKPPIQDYEQTVENEFFCMRLAKLMNINVAQVWIRKAGNIKILVIKRYDRQFVSGQGTRRIHQEDFCQALGKGSNQKYQHEGGPSLQDCFNLIDKVCTNPARDRDALLNAVIFNFLIGNHDAHGKNFSLLYLDGLITLAPLYDLMSTAVYPELSEKMAMKIGSKYKADEVMIRHWESLAQTCRFNPKLLIKRLHQQAQLMIEKTAALMQQLENEKDLDSPVFKKISEMFIKRARQINPL